MIYLSYFIHSWLVFVTPLKFLNYRPTARQQVLFTVIYGVGIIFSRNIYNFFNVPFGTHTVSLLILGAILFKNILKNFGWQKSIYTSLIIFIILLINDSLILIPVMKLLNLTIGGIEKDCILTFMLVIILSNLLLILIYITTTIRNLIYSRKSPEQYYN